MLELAAEFLSGFSDRISDLSKADHRPTFVPIVSLKIFLRDDKKSFMNIGLIKPTNDSSTEDMNNRD